MIISAFSGAGKTYLAKQYTGIIDLEPIDYHWIYKDALKKLDCEKRKRNQDRILNPAWPKNYIDDILLYDKDYNIVLISGDDHIVSLLDEQGIFCYNIYPSVNQKQDYIKRYMERGNSKEYIDFWNENFERTIIGKQIHMYNIEMMDGEYLKDTLRRIKII